MSNDSRWLMAAGFLCLLLFLPGLGGAFTFDSLTSLSRNTALGADPESFQAWLVAIGSSAAGPAGRPVSMFTFALTHGLFGHSAFLEKSINLLLHLSIGYLLYRWLGTLLQCAPALGWRREQAQQCAAAAALFWLFSPLQVSTVLYAVQRMEQLSALFTVLGLYLYTLRRSRWFDRAATPEELSRTLFQLTLLCLAAVFSKEDGILLLPLLALLEAVVFRGEYNNRQLPWLRWAAAAGLLVPVVAIAAFTVLDPDWLHRGRSWRGVDSQERLLTQSRVLWHYVSWFYWPDISRMSLFHDDISVSRGWLSPWTTVLAAAAWVALFAASLAMVRRLPLLAFCVGLFLIPHGIESTIIPLDLAYEHRSYLANAGLALLLMVMFYPRLPERSRRAVLLVCLLPFCVALGWRSVLWGDELRLYDSQLRHHPQSERTVYYYANMRMRMADEDRDEEQSREHVLTARRYFEYLLELDPQYLPALVSLLYIDSRWLPGLTTEPTLTALQWAAERRAMEPSDYNALNLLQECMAAGFCEIPEERLLTFVDTLMSRYPGSPTFPVFLARYYAEQVGDLEQAAIYSRQALSVAPWYSPAYYQLTTWYVAQDQRAQAAQVLVELLEQDQSLGTLRTVDKALK